MAYVFDLPYPDGMSISVRSSRVIRIEFTHPEQLFEFVELVQDLEVHLLTALGYGKKDL